VRANHKTNRLLGYVFNIAGEVADCTVSWLRLSLKKSETLIAEGFRFAVIEYVELNSNI